MNDGEIKQKDAEDIEKKYGAIRQQFGQPAEQFIRNLMPLYAESGGSLYRLWRATLNLYEQNGIIVFQPEMDFQAASDKILLRHTYQPGFADRSAFGFVDDQNVTFAEVPTDIGQWDGQVTNVTHAIIDLARTFHHQRIQPPHYRRTARANNPERMFAPLRVSDVLSDYIVYGTKPKFNPFTKEIREWGTLRNKRR